MWGHASRSLFWAFGIQKRFLRNPIHWLLIKIVASDHEYWENSYLSNKDEVNKKRKVYRVMDYDTYYLIQVRKITIIVENTSLTHS